MLTFPITTGQAELRRAAVETLDGIRLVKARIPGCFTTLGVSNEPIDMAQLIAEVNDDSAGAVVSFCGQVRNHDDARAVTAIDYEAHPDANVVVEQIVRQVEAGSGACKIAILHRVGHLDVGDVALGAAVSASHRNEAFAVLERVVEEVKLKLPVWKKQEFTDGSHEWTGCA